MSAPEPGEQPTRAPEDYPLPDSRIDLGADGTEPPPEPELTPGGNVLRTVLLTDPRLTDEQDARVAALREARQTLARRGLGSGPVTADEVTRVAEYILTGPAKPSAMFVETPPRPRTRPGWWFHDLPESVHWATVVAALALLVAAVGVATGLAPGW